MTEIDNSNEGILLKFSPRLRSIIKEVWTDSCIGISSKQMKLHINPIISYYPIFNTEKDVKRYMDNFTLEIPYAGKQLFWDIIFNEEDYNFPPDFEFPDSFLQDPDVNVIIDCIPSLANWNIDNPKSLLQVIREFMRLYKKYQFERLSTENKFARIYEEYKTLTSSELITSKDNLEIYIDHNSVVYFLLSFNVNYSNLPPYVQSKLTEKPTNILNPNEDTATLRMSFVKLDCSKVNCELQLSPRLEQALGTSAMLHIPSFNKDSKVDNYVLQLKKLLEDKVNEIAYHYRMKNEYISSILSLFGYGVIEYDSILFSRATLLCEVDDFYAIVNINIGNKFPQEKPQVILRSVYHTQSQSDKPVLQLLTSYPYSPRWTTQEMLTRLIRYLDDEILKFQPK